MITKVSSDKMVALVKAIEQLTSKKKPAASSGGGDPTRPVNTNSSEPLPGMPTNSDTTVAGEYRQEGLTDPGIIGGVTGTGAGPYIRS